MEDQGKETLHQTASIPRAQLDAEYALVLGPNVPSGSGVRSVGRYALVSTRRRDKLEQIAELANVLHLGGCTHKSTIFCLKHGDLLRALREALRDLERMDPV
jgi:hypothetical protein